MRTLAPAHIGPCPVDCHALAVVRFCRFVGPGEAACRSGDLVESGGSNTSHFEHPLAKRFERVRSLYSNILQSRPFLWRFAPWMYPDVHS